MQEKDGLEKKIVFQYNSLYCMLEARLAGTVSQYSLVCCDSQGLLGESRYKNCIVIEAAGLVGSAGHWAALVRRRGRTAGAGVGAGALGRQAAGRRWVRARTGRAGANERTGVSERGARGRRWAQAADAGARTKRHGRARGGRRQLGGRRARGRARQARGLGAGCAGWPGLCTRCTPLGFQPGFSTRYFS